MTLRNRKRGCLIGLAVGDALGAAVEFKSPGSFKPVSDYRAGGPHGLAPGEWTDDSSMALALADSIGQTGWDLTDQANRYLDWWKNGKYSVNGHCFDIGITTRSALSRFAKTGGALTSGDPSESASGNGSIMRLAPVPIFFADLFPSDVVKLSKLAAESSVVTHASPQCLSACRYFALVLAALIQGLDRDEVLAADWRPLVELIKAGLLHPAVRAVATGSFRTKRPPAIKGSGYVVMSLEAALWAFHSANGFEEAVLSAVNLGDDADTTGAVCGQLAGAFWGETGIPERWRKNLARLDMIEEALASLNVDEGQSRPHSPPVDASPESPLQLPPPPRFLTSNLQHKKQNEAAVEEALTFANKFDLQGLKAMSLPPSSKLRAWHDQLVTAVLKQIGQAEIQTPPTDSSYWVKPRQLLAGAYPGHSDSDLHRRKVLQLCEAGINVFINLMEANETDRKGRPFRPYEDIAKEVEPDASFFRCSIPDVSIPSHQQMVSILDTIDACLAEGKRVYVHCWGGVGRTGSVVGCWLIRHGLADSSNVISTLAELRRFDKERGHRTSPETAAQREFVQAWEQ